MYHVLLVDDEENVLQVLKDSIAWQNLGVVAGNQRSKPVRAPCVLLQCGRTKEGGTSA